MVTPQGKLHIFRISKGPRINGEPPRLRDGAQSPRVIPHGFRLGLLRPLIKAQRGYDWFLKYFTIRIFAYFYFEQTVTGAARTNLFLPMCW
jgi:hypothetical protein